MIFAYVDFSGQLARRATLHSDARTNEGPSYFTVSSVDGVFTLGSENLRFTMGRSGRLYVRVQIGAASPTTVDAISLLMGTSLGQTRDFRFGCREIDVDLS